MAKWLYTCLDNSGKRQAITVTAPDKFTAIRSGRDRAMKKAAGDIVRWDCKLKQA